MAALIARGTGQPRPAAVAREPIPPYGSAAAQDRIVRAAVRTCTHRHTFTCHKPPSGAVGCRLCMPQALVETQTAECVQLQPASDGPGYVVMQSPAAMEVDGTPRRHFSECPVAARDSRVLVWELGRPRIASPTVSEIASLPPRVGQWLRRVLPVQNGRVSTFSETALHVLACNQAALPLGGSVQAKSAMQYLVKYLTKDSNPLSGTLSMFAAARQHVDTHPSRAEDSGTSERTTLYTLQRLLNSITGSMELSATQAAALALGYNAEMSSAAFVTLYATAAVEHVRRLRAPAALPPEVEFGPLQDSRPASRMADDPAASDDEAELLSSDDEQRDEDDGPSRADVAELVDGTSTAPIFICDDGQRRAIPQHLNYALRGPALSSYSLYAYAALVKVVPRQEDSFARQPNARIEFDERHPLHRTYVQQLRSKFRIPQPMGIPPRVPRISPDALSATQVSAARRAALYYLVLFRPWTADSVERDDWSWRAFCDMCKTLQLGALTADGTRAGASLVDRAVLSVITNMAGGLSISRAAHRAQAAYRARARTVWRAGAGSSPDACEELHTGSSSDGEHAADAAGRVAVALARERAEAAAAVDAIAARAADTGRRAATHAFIDHSVGALARCAQGAAGAAAADPPPAYVLPATRVPDLFSALEDLHDAPPRADPVAAATAQPATSASPPAPMRLPDLGTLNAGQRDALRPLLAFLLGQRSDPPRLLVHGGPGCGKTYFVQHLVRCADAVGAEVVCGAFAAAAASLLPRGDTLHSLVGLGVRDARATRRPRQLERDKLAELQMRFAGARVLVIDEISMLDPVMLSHLSDRLKEITAQDADFGGLAVVACGDFFQLPPVSARPLPEAVLNDLPATAPVDSAFANGRRLFQTFQLVPLDQQQRAAGDAAWTALITELRHRRTLSRAALANLRPLRDSDAAEFANATVAVSGNQERAAIVWHRVRQFAAQRGMPVLAWPLPLREERVGSAGLTDRERRALWDSDLRLRGAFVPGAPAYLARNISSGATRRGICNGAAVLMHSLSFEDPAHADAVRRLAAAAQPGEVVWLPHLPLSVNVELTAAHDWPADLSLVAAGERPVIPITAVPGDAVAVTLPDGRTGTVVPHEHALDLAFAVTFHKLQGRTIDRLIVNLNQPPQAPFLSFESVYVALTRVRRGDHLRLVPPPPGKSFEHLLQLRARETTTHWLDGFDQEGVWRRQRALDSRARAPAARASARRGRRRAAAPVADAAATGAAPATQ